MDRLRFLPELLEYMEMVQMCSSVLIKMLQKLVRGYYIPVSKTNKHYSTNCSFFSIVYNYRFSTNLWDFFQTTRMAPKKILFVLYNSFIHSKLCFSIYLQGNASAVYLNKIIKFQKKFFSYNL